MKYIYLREDIERFSYDNIIDIEYYLNNDIINLILDNVQLINNPSNKPVSGEI